MRRCFAPGNDKLRYVRVYRRSGGSDATGFWYYRTFYYYQIVHHNIKKYLFPSDYIFQNVHTPIMLLD
jgi:hypothetical protein